MGDLVATLRTQIPNEAVPDDPDLMESYRFDKALSARPARLRPS
jgi:hypothetical protein